MKNHDRRRAPRFEITSSGAVHVPQELVVSYDLLDISEGGLSFIYRNKSDHENWVGEEREIDLFGESFFISDLSVKVVSDKTFNQCNVEKPLNTKTSHLHRCGMQFVILNQNQKNQVDSYLQSLDALHTQDN